MYYLYVLLCDKAVFYIGVTRNLEGRLANHKARHSPHTKRYRSVELVYTEKYSIRTKAEEREKQIKGWSREKKKALVDGDIEKLRELSRSKS